MVTKHYYGLTVTIAERTITHSFGGTDRYCSPDEFYLCIDKIAKFHVLARENTIYYEPHPGLQSPELILTWVYGTLYSYLLYYNNYLVIHGSAILVDEQAVIFCGQSGAGKSTLASASVKSGYPLLTDDIVALKQMRGGQFQVFPGPPQVKLWRDSLDRLGFSSEGLKACLRRAEKYAVPINNYASKPVALARMYELALHQEPGPFAIIRRKPDEKVQLLVRHSYRYSLLKPIGKLSAHFQMMLKLAEATPVYSAFRDKNHLPMQFASAVHEHMQPLCKVNC